MCESNFTVQTTRRSRAYRIVLLNSSSDVVARAKAISRGLRGFFHVFLIKPNAAVGRLVRCAPQILRDRFRDFFLFSNLFFFFFNFIHIYFFNSVYLFLFFFGHLRFTERKQTWFFRIPSRPQTVIPRSLLFGRNIFKKRHWTKQSKRLSTERRPVFFSSKAIISIIFSVIVSPISIVVRSVLLWNELKKKIYFNYFLNRV